MLNLVKLILVLFLDLVLHKIYPISGYTTHVLLETSIQLVNRDNPNVLDYAIHLHKYGFIGSLTTYINFKLKGRTSAAIFLLPAESMALEDDFYFLRIGVLEDSTRQLFYRPNKTGQNQLMTNVFETEADNDIMLPFYIRWDNGTIRAGQGTVENQSYFLSWEDNAFNVKSVAICNLWYELGTWEVEIEDIENTLLQRSDITAQFSGFFSKCNRTNIRGNMTMLESVTMDNRRRCARICAEETRCFGYNYNEHEKKCELISTGQLIVESQAEGWDFYRKCIAQHRGCQCS